MLHRKEYIEGGATGENVSVTDTQHALLDSSDCGFRIRGWGQNKEEAIQNAALGMFSYHIDDMEKVAIRDKYVFGISGAVTLNCLLLKFYNTLLSASTINDYFIPRQVIIKSFDETNFSIEAVAYGEKLDPARHSLGKEFKGVTNEFEFREEGNVVSVIIRGIC